MVRRPPRPGSRLHAGIQQFAIIVLSYFLAHGTTALLIRPVQGSLVPEVTVFASFVYLPHGVRVLATWLWGWRAIFPLFLSAYASHLVFTPMGDRVLLEPVVLESLAVGALSAFVAFGMLRLFGLPSFSGVERKLTWKALLLAGALASLFNSTGQSIVFSGLIVPENALSIFLVYAIGDLVGLAVCMVLLMLVFRWMRRWSK